MNDRLNGFLWGTAMGAGAAVIVGLSMGWVVSSAKANVMANERAQTVLVAAMTPICVNKFRDAEGYAANLAALKGIKERPAEHGPHQQSDLAAEQAWDVAWASFTDLAAAMSCYPGGGHA